LIAAPIPEVLRLWQKNNGCDDVPNKSFIPDANPNDGTTTERWIYQNCLDNGELIHYRVLNGGHTWPGASGNGLGTSRDFHASTVIWQFFYNQSLSGLSSSTNNGNRLEMLAYPNPAEEELTLSFPQQGTYHISLFTMTGSKILETYVSQNIAQIKLDNLRSGIYNVLVKSDLQHASMKFVKL
jgi:polyhydroxybutyrate depolymerase